MSSFPDFRTFCQDACIKAWGEPDRRTKSELRWGDDSYNYRTYDVRKRAWYDAGAQCGGSTLELAEFRKGKPIKDLRGARFFEAWKDAFELEFVPDPPPQMNGGGKPIIATYPYTDEQGTLLYEVVRFDSTDPLERFKQRRPDGNGGWIWKTKGIRQVLFRLPQLVAAVKAGQRVLVCEGERDANTAAKLGYAATTNPGGVKKWKKDYDEFFRGTDVVVVSDNDANGEGQAHADSVARRLSKIAARVRLVMFPVKDLSQWADTGGTREQLDALIEQAAPIDKDHADTKEAGKEDYMAGKTNLASNVGNVLLALTQEPEIMNAFGYDEMLRTEVLLRPLFTNDPNFTARPVTDADVCAVQAHLQWFGFRRLGKGAMHEAIDKHARDHAFHPVRDYLEALHWDGIERVRTWLKTYLGAKQNKYTEGIGTMLLVGMVARVYEPGCKFDYLPILEGGQGTFKSTACAVLAGEYFSDHLPDITGKEASQHLRGKWIIEVSELRAYNRAVVAAFKEFLTRHTECYRPPWGRKEAIEPRQCVLIGTTNAPLYLKDETGNRRFWPIKCGKIDIEALRGDRDQLFAEAVKLYRGGRHWWPDAKFEQRCIAEEQEARFEADAWEPMIHRYLDRLHEKRTSVLHVAIGALDYEGERPLVPRSKDEPRQERGTPINRLGPGEQRRIAGILIHLGWVPKRNRRERWWEPGPKAKR
jgi:hypothetical protein